MTNNIQCSIESSTTKIELNSAAEGVFLVPELEGLAGLPEIRTTSGVNAGYDGGWTSAQNYDARLISIRGIIANPDVAQVEAKRRAIASLLGQGRKEQLTLRLTTEAGNSYAISVRTISCEMALQRVLTTQEFLIQLRADDPLIYDDGASAGTEAILHVQRALGGFEINFELPLAIGGGAESTTVENGAEMVYPIIKMYGPLHSPTVVNTTTNQQMQLNADLQYTINWSGYENEEGSAIAISDGIENAPMSLTQLNGNATQTTYSGKNLWNLNATYYDLGSTASASGQTTTVTKAQDGDYRYALAKLPSSCTAQMLGKTVYFSFTKNSSISTVKSGIRVFWCNSGTSVGQSIISTTLLTTSNGSFSTYATIPATAPDNSYPEIAILFYPDMTNLPVANSATMKIENLQVEIGAVTAYEPYVGGTASPNPDYPQAIETVTGGQTIGVVGKNLLNAQKVVADSNNAETYITSDGNWVRFKTGGIQMIIKNPIQTQGAVTLTAIVKSGVATSNSFGLTAHYTDGTQLSLDALATTDTNEHTFTWTSDSSKTLDYLNTRNTWSKEMFMKIAGSQLELGSTATAYEPYQGQSYEVNLGGTNLVNQSELIAGYVQSNGYPTVSQTQAEMRTDYLEVEPNTTYTFSIQATTDTYSPWFGWCEYTGQTPTTVIGERQVVSSNPATFTTSATAKYVILSARNLQHATKVQLEKRSTATPYVPFVTYAYELCKIGTYQDYIWNDDGAWKIHKEVGKVVLNGTEVNIGTYPYGTNSYLLSDTGAATAYTTMTLAISDHFIGVPYDSRTQSLQNMIYTDGGTLGQIDIRNTSWASLADFKTWLGSNRPSIYFVLLEPTDTEITDDTLLAQLNTISELYPGVNNISIVPSAGAQGTMEVKYPTVKTITQDVAVIDSQARTITINGQDAYHLKTDESEFLLLAPGENKLYLTSATDTDEGYAEVKFKQGYLSI